MSNQIKPEAGKTWINKRHQNIVAEIKSITPDNYLFFNRIDNAYGDQWAEGMTVERFVKYYRPQEEEQPEEVVLYADRVEVCGIDITDRSYWDRKREDTVKKVVLESEWSVANTFHIGITDEIVSAKTVEVYNVREVGESTIVTVIYGEGQTSDFEINLFVRLFNHADTTSELTHKERVKAYICKTPPHAKVFEVQQQLEAEHLKRRAAEVECETLRGTIKGLVLIYGANAAEASQEGGEESIYAINQMIKYLNGVHGNG